MRENELLNKALLEKFQTVLLTNYHQIIKSKIIN